MTRRIEQIALPAMSPGTARHLTVFRYGRPGARPKAYLQAAIHANEMPGVMALHHLVPMLDAADKAGRIKGEIVIVPTANPIGLAQLLHNTHVGRYDFLNRENFNRNYPDLFAPVAERVEGKLGRDAQRNVKLIRAAALDALDGLQPANELDTLRCALMRLSADADLVLDLHCDMVAALHLFISARDRESARDLAGYLGAQATMFNEAPPATMTFSGANGAYWWKLAERFGEAVPVPQACFSVTVEFRGQGDVTHALGARDATALLRFLTRRGVIGGGAPAVPRLKGAVTPIGGMDVGYSPGTGIVTYLKPAGAKVRAGEVICEIIDPIAADPTRARSPLETRASGVLFSRRSDGQLVWPGRVLFRVAGATPLPHRAGRSGLDD